MLIYNTPNIIPAGTVMNTTLNSVALQLENMYGYAIQLVFTGTPNGTFKLQSSCDAVVKFNLAPQANGKIVYTPVNWTDIAGSPAAASAAGDIMWDFSELDGSNFVRVVYTDLSAGASTAIITVAQFNGKGN